MGTKSVIKRSAAVSKETYFGAIKEFLTEKEVENRSEKTIRNYEEQLGIFSKFIGATDATAINDINKLLVQSWIKDMMDNGIKPISINCYLRGVRSFLYWCMEEEREYITPSFRISELTVQEEEDKYFTDEELELLLAKPNEECNSFPTWRTWAMITLSLATGARIGSMRELKMKDIELSNTDNAYVNYTQTKTNKFLSVPLVSDAVKNLKKYVKEWRGSAADDDYLFCNQSGRQLTHNAARLALEDYCKARGVTHWNWHGFRHSFAIKYVSNGGDSIKLQKTLGHSSMRQTQHYVDKYAVDLRSGLEEVAAISVITKKTTKEKVIKRNK